MNTTVSTKLAALVLALAVNTVLMGSVAYLFNVQQMQLLPLTAQQVSVNLVAAS